MNYRVLLGYFAAAFLLLALATNTAFAQQNATIVGTVTDESQAVMPGATVTAKDVATGRTFMSVSEATGEYRLPAVPPGRYTIQAELSGFATAVTREIEVLVGQNLTMNFSMKLASLNETVNVVAEAPLVDTQSARVAGNVDRRQMELLPVNGRNWMELTMMVKGVTTNSITHMPTSKDAYYQLNVDGQQVTQSDCCAWALGQPRISQEAIGEYQVATTLFDITAGRSLGMQINAVTKSGTNRHSGSMFAFIRDDRFNAKDFIAKRVLPYSNQQMGFSVGGPILTDKLHYFGVFEYEREPSTLVMAPAALPGQRITADSKFTQKQAFGRLDYQLSQKDHLMGRFMAFKRFNPRSAEALGTSASIVTNPNQLIWFQQTAHSAQVEWNRVISNRTIQQLTIGENYYNYFLNWADNVPNTPRYNFPGFSWGAINWFPNPEYLGYPFSGRYQLTSQKGRHEIKMGGELIYNMDYGIFVPGAWGVFSFASLPPDLGQRFRLEDWDDPSRWGLAGLDPYVLFYDVTLLTDEAVAGPLRTRNPHEHPSFDLPRPQWAAWFGDNWRVNDRLTLNLGVRYDLGWNDFIVKDYPAADIIIDNGKFVENVGYKPGIRDVNNVAPRVGFAWTADEGGSLVIRGGSGMFYGTNGDNYLNYMGYANKSLLLRVNNDGQPGFILDPLRGATADDYVSGRKATGPRKEITMARDVKQPVSWQHMIGFQKQLGGLTAFDADIVYLRGYNEMGRRDPNLFYDPATGFNKNPNIFGRPNPAYSNINLYTADVESDYMAMVSSFTRRYSGKFQAGVTYTLMFFKNDNGMEGAANNPFDRDADWGRARDFQRHTARVNGVYQLPVGLSLSGMLKYGSGNYFQISPGVNALVNDGTGRTRRDLTVVPKNSFLGDSYFTTDLRLTKTFRVGGTRLEGMAEVFNVFNRARYDRNTIETSPAFGAPVLTSPPRQGQLAVRVSF